MKLEVNRWYQLGDGRLFKMLVDDNGEIRRHFGEGLYHWSGVTWREKDLENWVDRDVKARPDLDKDIIVQKDLEELLK